MCWLSLSKFKIKFRIEQYTKLYKAANQLLKRAQMEKQLLKIINLNQFYISSSIKIILLVNLSDLKQMIQDFRDLDDKNTASPIKKKQQGYIQNHYQHMMPILSQPKIAERKEAAQKTALQKCFRSFIREKMFGSLMNKYEDKDSLKPSHKHCNSFNQFDRTTIKDNQIEVKNTFLIFKDGLAFNQKIPENKLQHLKNNRHRRQIPPSQRTKIQSISINISQMKKNQLNQSFSLKEQFKVPSKKTIALYNQSKIKTLLLRELKPDSKPDSKKASTYNSGRYTQDLTDNKQSYKQYDRRQQNKNKNSYLEASHADLSFLSSVDIPARRLMLPPVKKSDKPMQKQKTKKNLFSEQLISVEVWSNITVQNTRLKQAPRGTAHGNKMILAILSYAALLLDSKVLSRQLYLKYMKTPFQRLSSRFLKYFDTKFRDGMSRNQYANEINESLIKAPSRVWGFMCFQFFDIDKNGVIDNGDLFSLYRMIQQQIPEQVIDLEANNGFQTFQSRKQVCRQILLKQINILNAEVSINKKIIDQISLLQNQDSHLSMGKQEKHYELLQESFIKNHNAVAKDVQQIVKQDELLKNPIQKKFAVNITEDLQVKFTSIYRQSFLATQHNQDTRIHREKVQKLRQELKEQRKNRKIKNGGITYKHFLQNSFEQNLKAYIVKFHGWQGFL